MFYNISEKKKTTTVVPCYSKCHIAWCNWKLKRAEILIVAEGKVDHVSTIPKKFIYFNIYSIPSLLNDPKSCLLHLIKQS